VSFGQKRTLLCAQERDCDLIDEDAVCDYLEDEDGINIAAGGYLVESHACVSEYTLVIVCVRVPVLVQA
jgi:hypothetical protein